MVRNRSGAEIGTVDTPFAGHNYAAEQIQVDQQRYYSSDRYQACLDHFRSMPRADVEKLRRSYERLKRQSDARARAMIKQRQERNNQPDEMPAASPPSPAPETQSDDDSDRDSSSAADEAPPPRLPTQIPDDE